MSPDVAHNVLQGILVLLSREWHVDKRASGNRISSSSRFGGSSGRSRSEFGSAAAGNNRFASEIGCGDKQEQIAKGLNESRIYRVDRKGP